MHLKKIFLLAIVFSFILVSAADARKKKKKRVKSNPDIRCSMEYRLTGSSPLSYIEVRQKKIRWKVKDFDKSKNIEQGEGDDICNEISQILWKKLVEAEPIKNCSNKTKILVREKKHTICLDSLENNPNYINLGKLKEKYFP